MLWTGGGGGYIGYIFNTKYCFSFVILGTGFFDLSVEATNFIFYLKILSDTLSVPALICGFSFIFTEFSLNMNRKDFLMSWVIVVKEVR